MTHPQQIYDRERISLNIVRLKKGGKTFEIILSDPDGALKLRRGVSDISIEDVLKSTKIFSDARKAEVASEHDIRSVFPDQSDNEIIETIIKEGEFHLTAEQKRGVLDRKRNEIINYIHMNAIDPRSGLPHPKQRIELAMEQARIHINMYESVMSQIEKVVKELRPILPMSFEKIRLRITLPATYASKGYSVLKSRYSIHREAWNNDGSVMIEIVSQAGQKPEIFDSVNKLTRGEAHITEVKE